MALIERSTHQREQIARVIFTLIRGAWARFFTSLKHRKHPHVADLSDHHLRDIGLKDPRHAPTKHKFPSQHMHHPRG